MATTKEKTKTKKPAEKKEKKETVKKVTVSKKKVSAKPEVKEEIVKEVKTAEVKLNNIDFGLPQSPVDDDDFVINEDDFKGDSDKYFNGIGRRKTAIARIRLYTKGDKA